MCCEASSRSTLTSTTTARHSTWQPRALRVSRASLNVVNCQQRPTRCDRCGRRDGRAEQWQVRFRRLGAGDDAPPNYVLVGEEESNEYMEGFSRAH